MMPPVPPQEDPQKKKFSNFTYQKKVAIHIFLIGETQNEEEKEEQPGISNSKLQQQWAASEKSLLSLELYHLPPTKKQPPIE